MWKFSTPLSSYMASNAHYRVYTGYGPSLWMLIDWTTGGDEWVHLGTWPFTNASPLAVVLSDEANGYVIADAVKLVPAY